MRTDAVIGRTLAGRFRVTSFLGEGAMAAVYRGEQDEEPRQVAIKVMHPHLATDETFPKRFRREAKAAKALSHPNVVRIIDYGVDGDLAYIAMELLAGQDLFEVLEKRGKLPADVAGRVMIRVLSALDAAHERGIVHRDLKPENVMVQGSLDGTGQLDVKVLDFGVAKIVAPGATTDDAPTHVSGSGLTSAGAVLGTPEYMSPEQCQGAPLDVRTDVYSAGVLLYQLVTGHVPFRGPSPVHTMLSHVRDAPAPPRQIVPALDAEVEAVILKALAKPLADRYQSAVAFREALAQVVARIERSAPRAEIEPVPQSTSKRTRTPRGLTEPLTPISVETSIVEITAVEAPDTSPNAAAVVPERFAPERAVPPPTPSPLMAAPAPPIAAPVPPPPPMAPPAAPGVAPSVVASSVAAAPPTWVAAPMPPAVATPTPAGVQEPPAQLPSSALIIYVITFVAVFVFVLGLLSLLVFG
jgi:serine/threonine-protein kinase